MTLLDVSHTLGVPTSTLLQIIFPCSISPPHAVHFVRRGVFNLCDATVQPDAPYSFFASRHFILHRFKFLRGDDGFVRIFHI
ncbi:MAG: hypothetical protein WC340_18950, partial [Kiritimatiellia bacterium]